MDRYHFTFSGVFADIAGRAYLLNYFCPSVRTCQRDSYCAVIREIWYLRLLRKSVEKLQIWLKSDHNSGHFTWRLKYFYTVDNRKKYFVDGQESKGTPFLHLHDNNRYRKTSQWHIIRMYYIACLIYVLSSSKSGQHI